MNEIHFEVKTSRSQQEYILDADKLMVMGNSKNLCAFNFAILLKLRKFDARKIQYTCFTVFY